MTEIEAAKELKQESSGMISRYESGQVLPPWSTVRILLTAYSATPEDLERASRFYDEAADEPKSVRLTAGASKAFRTLVNAEREATRERELAVSVIPGLLQTERYARALIDAGQTLHHPDMRHEAVISVRMDRQKPLEGPNPMVLHALLDEAAVRRMVGGRETFAQQLAHVLTMSERPNITVQVIPLYVGAYGTMNGTFIIVDYPEPEAVPGVYLEYPAGGAWVHNEDDVKRFTATFDEVARLAFSPAASRDIIHQQQKALKKR